MSDPPIIFKSICLILKGPNLSFRFRLKIGSRLAKQIDFACFFCLLGSLYYIVVVVIYTTHHDLGDLQDLGDLVGVEVPE